jgi:Amt family ammonium transporter
VGFLSTDNGLFYGGDAAQLGSQLIGVGVSKHIEEEGLDIYEHGESAYN